MARRAVIRSGWSRRVGRRCCDLSLRYRAPSPDRPLCAMLRHLRAQRTHARARGERGRCRWASARATAAAGSLARVQQRRHRGRRRARSRAASTRRSVRRWMWKEPPRSFPPRVRARDQPARLRQASEHFASTRRCASQHRRAKTPHDAIHRKSAQRAQRVPACARATDCKAFDERGSLHDDDSLARWAWVKPPRGDGERKCKHRRMALVQSIDERLHPLRAALTAQIQSYP